MLRILMADKVIRRMYGDVNATITESRARKEVKLDLPLEVEGGNKMSLAFLLLPLAFVFFGGERHGG